MRRWSALLLFLVIALSVFVLRTSPATAASYRNHIARVPSTPTSSQSARVWVQSDTVSGETAGLEYQINGTYTKVLGTYDTGGPSPANWRIDIPAQANGTYVQYQLFTRNQSGGDYGFTGFNWNYTVSNGDIMANSLRHYSFSSYYRSPFGAVTAGTPVTLRFGTRPNDVQSAIVRVYTYNPSTQTTAGPVDYPMVYLEDKVEDGVTYAEWTYTLTTPSTPSILYYKFKATDQATTAWYNDDFADEHDNLHQGGTGVQEGSETSKSFQITVYDAAFTTPSWLANANVYQIFPDRFRNGDTSNDYCRAGSTTGCPVFYGDQNIVAHTTWNEAIYDPRVAGDYFNTYGTQFFGGDLDGITEKLDYLHSMGIDTLYLTPIFKAQSNHRYDTDNYMEIDPALGGQPAYDRLVAGLNARGMHLILDGVFNHSSSDSLYFDRYHRYATDGACESLSSVYRPWYLFNNSNVPCTGADYPGWFGFDSLAVYDDASTALRNYIYRDSTSVIKHWYDAGTSGWRFDVADEISHDWWRDFRPYAKADNSTGPLIGEVWYDASPYLLGDQLDSVMNYRFRKSILGFARGDGIDWNDNDSNGSNNIVGLAPSEFDRSLTSIREDYPLAAQQAMLNLVDSHDTNRALYVLTETGDNGLTQAKERLKLTALFQYTWVGAPTVYYGDEAAINSPSLANGSNGPEDDPYNRAPYPWADESGSTSVYGPADTTVLSYYGTLGQMRKGHPALRTGSIQTVLAGDLTASATDNSTYAFARIGDTETGIIAMNNGSSSNSAALTVSAYFTNGTVLQDALTGANYTVSGGVVNVTMPAFGGVVLFVQPAVVPTWTPTNTPVPTSTATGTATNTSIPTSTATETAVPTNTATASNTSTATATETDQPTNTATATDVPTETATNTAVPPTSTSTSTATATALPGTPVAWINTVKVSASGNSISKTSSPGGWDAGAASSLQITSGDGAVQMTVADTNSYVMFGLSHNDSNVDFSDIDFAIYTYASQNQLAVYEGGVYRAGFSSYAAGDVLKVAVQSGVVKYSKNGVVFYSSSVAPTYPLLLDASIWTPGASVSDAYIIGSNISSVTPWTPTASPTSTSTPASVVAQNTSWINLTKASASANNLTKTDSSSGWDAGGAASMQINGGEGYAQMTVADTASYVMFGLSKTHNSPAYSELSYGIYTYASQNQLAVYESGVYRATGPGYAAGDTIRVALEGGAIKYSKNGVVFYTSSVAPSYPLKEVGDIYTPGASINNAIIAGNNLIANPAWTPTPSATPTNTAVPVTCNPVVYTSAVNVNVTGNTITKSSASEAWNAGAISNVAITSGEGAVSATVADIFSYAMIGLGTGDNAGGYATIRYAIYTYANTGQLAVYENGAYKGSGPAYVAGDTIKVAVEGGQAKYYKNGLLFYISQIAITYPLKLNATIFTPGASINNAQICGSGLTVSAAAAARSDNVPADRLPAAPASPGAVPAQPVVGAKSGVQEVPAAPVVPQGGDNWGVPAQPVVPVAADSFLDVPADHWAAQYVAWATQRLSLSGYSVPGGREFRPDQHATRGQVVKLLVGATGWSLVSGSGRFSDVAESSPFYAWIETAVAHNLISGYSDGTFRPNEVLTRAQMTKLLVLAAGWQEQQPGAAPFNDVAADSWAAGYIAAAVEHGAVSGYADGSFRPAAPLTRAQMVKLLYFAFAQQ